MRVLLFSGTSEGHALCRFLFERGARADVYVATEYGQAVLEPLPGITVHTGRLSAPELAREIGEGALVIDATHPYAREISENLRAACRGSEYLRLLRPRTAAADGVTVPDTAAAADWLNVHPGRALLTTGSKELAAFTAVSGYRERLFPRVLPSVQALEVCAALGFPSAHIIAMQGPFDRALNAALLRQIHAAYLVTKDTGAAGGFAEKAAAARDAGARLLVIARPTEEEGLTLAEAERLLTERLSLREPQPAPEPKPQAVPEPEAHTVPEPEAQPKPQAVLEPQEPPRFPLFVSLSGRKALLAGAGAIAARRAEVLRRYGAEVSIVAPENRAGLSPVTLRGFQPPDLEGAALAVAATDDRAVNHEIARLCGQRGIPVSVADAAGESTFFFPAVCTGNGLSAGVVSDGSGHRKVRETAVKIRELLDGGGV